jgi:hypothetical protein
VRPSFPIRRSMRPRSSSYDPHMVCSRIALLSSGSFSNSQPMAEQQHRQHRHPQPLH